METPLRSDRMMRAEQTVFDAETWALLPNYFERIPNSVRLKLWADAKSSLGEREALRLGQTLAGEFEKIEMAYYPRLATYPYYPVMAVVGLHESEEVDYGVRIIGLPSGTQLTSLIAAIQTVSFRGVTLEPTTRLQLRGLRKDLQLEILTTANDESGSLLAKHAFGFAVTSPKIRTMLIMADVFPEAGVRYSVSSYPHIVINGRHHVSGFLEEEQLLRQIAAVAKQETDG